MPPKRTRQATLSFGVNGLEARRPKRVARQLWNNPDDAMTLFVRFPSVVAPGGSVAEPSGTDGACGAQTVLPASPTEEAPTRRVCAFDLDDTIVSTKSGRQFPSDASDWKFRTSRVVKCLKEEHASGNILVVFTNQGGVARGLIDIGAVQDRIDNIAEAIEVPVFFYVATAKDHFRKPSTGMWKRFEKDIGGSTFIDLEASLFCGDAAGRPAKPGRRRDFADTDLQFARNIGLEFKTPEEYFDIRTS